MLKRPYSHRRPGRWIPTGAIFSIVISVSPAARAADTTKPDLEHYPCPSYQFDAPFALLTTIRDDSDLFEPRVHYRFGEDGSWQNVKLERVEAPGDVYRAVVDTAGQRQTLHYMLEVFDTMGNGPARHGSVVTPVEIEGSATAADCDQLTGAHYATPSAEPEVITATEVSASPETVVAALPAGAEPPMDAESAARFHLRLEPGMAMLFGQSQSKAFEPIGGGAIAHAGMSLWETGLLRGLDGELSGGFVAFKGADGRGVGTATLLGAGMRIDPWRGLDAWPVQPHAAFHLSYAQTGNLARLALDASVSADFDIAGLRVGPFVRYAQIFDRASSKVSSEDAILLSSGVGVALMGVESLLNGDSVASEPSELEHLASGPEPTSEPQAERAEAPSPPRDPDRVERERAIAPVTSDRADQEISRREVSSNRARRASAPATAKRNTAPASPPVPVAVATAPAASGDQDRDGYPDARDDCPTEAETFNTVEDEDGCPDASLTRAYANPASGTIEILRPLEFNKDTDKLILEDTWTLVDVVDILQEYPQIRKLRVEGHAGFEEPRQSAVARWRELAYPVRGCLLRQGVARGRLDVQAYAPMENTQRGYIVFRLREISPLAAE